MAVLKRPISECAGRSDKRTRSGLVNIKWQSASLPIVVKPAICAEVMSICTRRAARGARGRHVHKGEYRRDVPESAWELVNRDNGSAGACLLLS